MTTAAVVDPAERQRRLWKVYALLLTWPSGRKLLRQTSRAISLNLWD